MLKTLKTLLGTAKSATATSDEIEAALVEARAGRDIAATALAGAEEGYRGSLLDPDERATASASDRVGQAKVALDRAEALVAALTVKLGASRHAEADAVRRRAYDAAATERDALAKRLRTEYPRAAKIIATIVADLSAFDDRLAKVNAALPVDAAPLSSPEAMVRTVGAVPTEVISERTVDRWCSLASGSPLDETTAAQVRSTGRNTGSLPPSGSIVRSSMPVERRRFRETAFHPAISAAFASPLVETVRLPGLVATDASHWPPVPGIGQAISRPIEVALEPAGTLALVTMKDAA